MGKRQPDDKPLVLVTLFGGGWHRQIYRILEKIPAEEFEFVYAYGHNSGVHAAAEAPMPHAGQCYPIHYLGPTRKHSFWFVGYVARLVMSFYESFRLIRRLRPDAILALGTATAVPLFAAGRLFGIRCVFVESLTRVERMSLTGRILYHLRLADRFYVQWSALQRKFCRATFVGAAI